MQVQKNIKLRGKKMGKFLIDVTDLCWIDGSTDNADDLCLHGHAIVCIGNEQLEFEETRI